MALIARAWLVSLDFSASSCMTVAMVIADIMIVVEVSSILMLQPMLFVLEPHWKVRLNSFIQIRSFHVIILLLRLMMIRVIIMMMHTFFILIIMVIVTLTRPWLIRLDLYNTGDHFLALTETSEFILFSWRRSFTFWICIFWIESACKW